LKETAPNGRPKPTGCEREDNPPQRHWRLPNKTPQKPASSAPIAINPWKILFAVTAHTEEAQCILENFPRVYFEIVINDEMNLLPTEHS
jgi:hypothetical protein